VSASAVLARLQQELARPPAVSPVVVGFSGGVDSSVLLEGLIHLGIKPADVCPVHVHHGLAPQADDWTRHCYDLAVARGLDVIVEYAQVEEGANLEARARQARYQALAKHIPEGGLLLLGHHQDDQAETVLLRLMRGAGVSGLAGMNKLEARNRYQLARPLLDLPRASLVTAAREWGLDWIEDPGNSDPARDRNHLRARVRPALAEHWPGADQHIAASAAWLREAHGLLAERAAEDFAACQGAVDHLAIAGFRTLSGARQRNLLHWWCRRRGLRPPPGHLWQRLQAEVLDLPRDRQPRLEWADGCVTRFTDRLYLLSAHELAPVGEAANWEPETRILDFGPFRLERTGADQADLALAAPGDGLEVRAARGGERLYCHGMHRRLVELWRQRGIPPWQRRQLPLLYAGETLVAAAGAGVADDWQSRGDATGMGIAVRRPDGERAL
jgi:tRNA(Ile)-lysidine synthase